MATYKIRCKRNYRKIKIDELDVFALIVLNGIFTNMMTFPMPPIAQPMFQSLIDTYMSKRSGYKGGTVSKGDFELAKEALIQALYTLATYVDSVAQGDVNIILLSGYEPTKGSPSASIPPARAENVKLEIAAPSEMSASCNVVLGAETYGAILSANIPLPPDITVNGFGQIIINDDAGEATTAVTLSSVRFILDLNKSRIKKFRGLTKGTVYYLYYFSVNSAGVSPLSIAVSLDAW